VSDQLDASATLFPGQDPLSTLWIWDWVSLEPDWTMRRNKNSLLYRNWNCDSSVAKPVASRYTDWATAAHKITMARVSWINNVLFCMQTLHSAINVTPGEWSASRLCRFASGARPLGTHWIEGSVDPRAGLDYVEKWKFVTLPRPKFRTRCHPHTKHRIGRKLGLCLKGGT
jgi:hypothetical protein